MATEQILQVDRGLLEKPEMANQRSTRLRSELRVVQVYVEVEDARHFAELGADARLIVLPSSGGRRRRDHGRFLTTVLMTDIIDSTHTVERLGDRRWRELLAEHYADCRTEVNNDGGELVDTTGDGIIAIFDAPTRAVRAAIAIQAGARESGISVRAGVHAGECERMGAGLAGLAVHIAARICALGAANEVVTTGTVRDLVTGSMLTFEPRGRHELRGVPGDWTIFRAH